MQVAASLCITAGTLQIYLTVKWIYLRKKSLKDCWMAMLIQTFSKKLLIFMLLGMGLVAIGPVTNADALDNHLGVAIEILNNGGIFVAPEWFHGRQTGNGEVLNAMAISVGAEQFGSLLQYVSLLGIVGIILFARNIDDKLDAYSRIVYPI